MQHKGERRKGKQALCRLVSFAKECLSGRRHLENQDRRDRQTQSMDSLEEFDALVEKIGQGDRAAFLRFYALTSPRLYGLCKAILDDDAWAEEVLESVYLSLWQATVAGGFGGLSPLTWLIDEARGAAVRARRSMASEDGVDPVEVVALTPSAQMRGSGEAPPLLRKALAWLPDDRRDAVLLGYFTGLRYPDLATRFRVPYATMRNWQRRSLERLFKDLTGREASEDVVLVGEYVLGVLPQKEVSDFEKRLRQEDELYQVLVNWTEDFVVLTDSLPDAVPSGAVQERLDLALFGEQTAPLWKRLYLGQALAAAVLAAAVAYFGQPYLPALIEATPFAAQTPAPAVTAPPSLPQQADPGADLGPGAHVDPAGGVLQINGAFPELIGQGNLAVYLDFGENSEWLELGAWPETPPRRLPLAAEIIGIAAGAEVVILGGPGSDQELLRLPLN